MIRNDSRYANSKITIFLDWDGFYKEFVHPRVGFVGQSMSGFSRPVQNGEELDFTAYNNFGHEKSWHVLAEANHIFFGLDLTEGDELFIPT